MLAGFGALGLNDNLGALEVTLVVVVVVVVWEMFMSGVCCPVVCCSG